jgi:lantibiotic modifying enzyme
LTANLERIARELRVLGGARCRTSPATIEEALQPIVIFALKQLRNAAAAAIHEIVAPSAWRSLGAHLDRRLMFALSATMRIEQMAARAISISSKTKSARCGISFYETVRAFPGLLETTAQLIAAWINAQEELLTRLQRDRGRLLKYFAPDKSSLRATAIHPGLSDPHNGGRTVTLIELSENRRLIYKPRNSDGEELWHAALRWLNETGVAPRFRIPRLLARGDYHWMEFLRTSSCRSSKAVGWFYFRWGAQAALAQVLKASDLHRENWLAVGSQPILVDAELIWTKQQRWSGKMFQDRHSLSALLETGLLPLTARDRAGFYRGIAPFDSALSKRAPIYCWPRHDGALVPPRKYVSDLVRGFEAVTEILSKRERAREFFDQTILPRPGTTNARILFRASEKYARILRQSLEPSKMISAGQRWRWIARECCASAASRRIGLAETRALLRCDLPKFTARKRNVPATWKQFALAIAELKGSSNVLRRRVLWGARSRS